MNKTPPSAPTPTLAVVRCRAPNRFQLLTIQARAHCKLNEKLLKVRPKQRIKPHHRPRNQPEARSHGVCDCHLRVPSISEAELGCERGDENIVSGEDVGENVREANREASYTPQSDQS
ncbi:hypothetical protein A1Q1_03370 [Trichosporon asahii var. asahii CBS 2479]|uniref:Uncharacterized protein n=1 Tax=Trichosporon asahii var. asahii (strain ATCC 90039 / CBS 2479 / JCM 2466 / KCTC 7840 / NBRC 103889/ NCYC 2677 / UAMH 7654) TaxID=1186058 RepID=J5RGV9_TRIAS|nr:hypothetical protein A1Q1_03370 [Trichosporon asahii var. asahii CBS 2479]EJT52568.1 hypothetical protein A1Q1_03370 [Trichosporon asahii var. asahii CBS 2479]